MSHPKKITRETRLGIITIYTLKVMPALLALCYMVYYLLLSFDIEWLELYRIADVSLLPLIFMYLCSYAFKFCAYHRVFLHYILIANIIEYWEQGYGIPVTNETLLHLRLLLIVPTFFIAIYYYVKHHQKASASVRQRH
ncbi:MAG: hypothetical protein IKH52_08105 [Bacteroidaceae bacterium]|nr:hypothetical protein [Bacteroidaceae bacterium]